MARLILEYGNEVLRDHTLRRGSVTIGRHKDNTIILDHSEVSNFHARIDRRGADYILTDLQSTNGTFLNDKKVISCRLEHGDKVKVGAYELLFVGTEKARISAEEEKLDLASTVIVVPKTRVPDKLPKQETLAIKETGTQGHRRPMPTGRRIFLFFFVIFMAIGVLLLSYKPTVTKRMLARIGLGEKKGDDPERVAKPARKTGTDEPEETVTQKKGTTKPLTFSEIAQSEPPLVFQEETSAQASIEARVRTANSIPASSEMEEPTSENETEPAGFNLDGIVWSNDRRHSLAVINGYVVRMGATIDGAKVIDMGKNYVTLQFPDGGSEFRLVLR